MSYGSDFVLTLFTNNLDLAKRADEAKINRIGLDLEVIGKSERQAHLNTWISDHKESDLPALRETLCKAELFVRTNPIHSNSRDEIERLIDGGADVLMLPFFETVEEVQTFVDLVGTRAAVSLLVETAPATVRIEEIVQIKGVDEIHIGLNDLHLSIGLRNHFELLGSKLMEMLSDVVVQAGIPFGFGGIGRLGDERLPVPPDLVYAQFPRLKANRALVSRVFTTPDYRKLNLIKEVNIFRDRMDYWHDCSESDLHHARDQIKKLASAL